MTTLIVALLVISALCEVFGTVTVWGNYNRAARLAEEIRDEVGAEEHALEQLGDGKRMLLDIEDIGSSFRVAALEVRYRSAMIRFAGQLSRRPVATAGLFAYVFGALTGLAAGLVAIYR